MASSLRRPNLCYTARVDDRTREILTSSNQSDWATPSWLFAELNAEFAFQLDPCASIENFTCDRFFTEEDDGLKQDWGPGPIFANPPYGDTLPEWIRKAHEEFLKGYTVVLLVPARTDTKWWKYCLDGEIRFIQGRLRFNGSKNSATFPSVVIVLGDAYPPKIGKVYNARPVRQRRLSVPK